MDLSLTVLAIIIATGVAYSVFDLLRKRLTATLSGSAILVWLALLQVPIFVGAALLKEEWGLESAYWAAGLVSIVVNIFANVAFLRALEIAPLGLTIPLLSLTPAFASLLSIWVLNEFPTSRQWGGIVLVVIGAFLLTFDPGEGRSLGGVLRSLRKEPGSLLMMGVAFGWSITPPFDKVAIEASSPYTHGAILNLGVAFGVAIPLLMRRRSGQLSLRGAPVGVLVATVVVAFGALALLFQAYSVAWVGMVETIRRAVNAVLALAFGAWFFSEKIRTPQAVAVGVMGVGVALILL